MTPAPFPEALGGDGPVTVRPVDSDETHEISERLTFRAFGHGFDPTSYERRKPLRASGHFLIASRLGEDAGTAGTYDYDLTLPGGAAVAAAGITMVGVGPHHRRHGVLTALMRALLDDAQAEGKAAALLFASESTIYGRYGFGVAAPRAEADVAVRRAAFRSDTPVAPGRIHAHEIADAATLRPLLASVFDRARRRRPGEVSRSEAAWQVRLTPKAGKDDRLFLVHHDPEGTARGYATYSIKDNWGGHGPNHQLRVDELVADSDAVELALWRAVFDHDLVERLTAYVPVDWLVRDALVDSWAARMRWAGHSMWARLLDVPAALSARRYRAPGRLVLQVLDERQRVAGTYVVEVDAGGTGRCSRADQSPDLRVHGADLAGLWLGGMVASRLVRAGRIVEEVPGAAVRADLMFGWDPAPFTTEEF